MTADMIRNKKRNPIVTGVSLRDWEINIYLVFVTRSHFKVQKDVRLNITHCFIIKISNEKGVSTNCN